MLRDSYGRRHNNLRISVTDRCNLRCVYCMPEDVEFLPRTQLLSFEEITRFVAAAVPLGIDKLRLTGGEPLLRKDLPRLVAMLAAIPGVNDLGFTTNALLLERMAEPLRTAGLGRLNVSLDTLDPERFRELSRRDGVDAVLAGLAEAKRVGLGPIKVNAVAIRGYAEHDLVPLLGYCLENGFELRVIEYMPIGSEEWDRRRCVLAHEILEMIETAFGPVAPAADYDPNAPAMEFEITATKGRFGIIASVSRPFCRSCNRLRLTADGQLRNCLFARDEVDVKSILRLEPFDADRLAAAIRANVASKWEGHEINTAKFVKPLRTMHAIGG
jgi:GTP 3',8-cyclase